MRVQTITTSTAEPLSLEEVKSHLRLELGHAEEDDLLGGCIRSARDQAESYTNRKLLPTTIDLYFDDWPSNYFKLSHAPMSTNVALSITYTDYDSSTVTLGTTTYKVDYISEPGRVFLDSGQSWPSATLHAVNPIKIRYQLGYSSPDSIPQPIKTAMLLMIGDMYENREDTVVGNSQSVTSIPRGAKAFLNSYRVFKF